MMARNWYHFLGLTILAVGADLLVAAAGIHGGEPQIGWLRAMGLGAGRISGDLFVILPVTAAVTAGLIRDTATAATSGLRLAMAAMAILLVVDLLSNDALDSGRARLAVLGTETISLPGTDVGSVSAIRTIGAFVTSDLPGADEVLPRYPLDHPRLKLTTAFLKLALLLSPLVLIGFVTGTATWLSARVIFLHGSDEVVARVVLSWLLAPLVLWGIWSWTVGVRADVLFGGETPSLILVPLVPFAVIGLIGWWAAVPDKHRSVHSVEEAE